MKKLYVPLIAAMTVFFVVALGAMAIADNVQNDVVAGGNDTFVEGGSSTVNYRITANSGDGETGCNATVASPATVTINVPAGVTATPGSVSFTSCGTNKAVVFSSSTPGDYEITVSVSDGGPGTYNVNPAKFTLHVNPFTPTNTAPSLTLPISMTVEGNTTGGANVTYTGISASDTQDGDLTSAVTCSPASGSFFALGGPHLVECSVTDLGPGPLTTSGFFYVTVVDTTAPVIASHGDETAEATSSAGADVSYTSPSTSDVVWGSGTATCAPASGSTFPLGDTTVTCDATDGSSNAATSTTFVVHVVDTTPPTITWVSSVPAANGAGWNNSDVTVTWSCSDAVGVVSASVSVTVSTEGTDEAATGTCLDTPAGNTASDTQYLDIDKTAPYAPSGSAGAPPDYAGGGGWYKDSATVQWTDNGDPDLADSTAGSGVDASTVGPDDTFTTSGSHTAGDTVFDNAGNESVEGTLTVQVDATNPTASFSDCPTSSVVLGSSGSVNWTAQDAHSGLASAASGSVALVTNTIGSHTVYSSAPQDNVGHTGDAAACTYNVVYDWTGFFRPVDNKDLSGNPIFNVVKAGQAIPMKFNLGGNQGLNIFNSGYPKSSRVPCEATSPTDLIEETVTAGNSSLTYDSLANQYIYVWKTDKAYAGTCRVFDLGLNDGTTHLAYFKFTK